MKYNIGDKVRIKSVDWYEANKDRNGTVCLDGDVFLPQMAKLCGQVVVIDNVYPNRNAYTIKGHYAFWLEDMIDGYAEN